jgi:hypothetical protein
MLVSAFKIDINKMNIAFINFKSIFAVSNIAKFKYILLNQIFYRGIKIY